MPVSKMHLPSPSVPPNLKCSTGARFDRNLPHNEACLIHRHERDQRCLPAHRSLTLVWI